MVDAGLGQLAQVGEQRGRARLRVLAEVEAAGDGLLDGGEVAAETDKVTERALATFGPGERETVIRALAAIRRNLTGA